MTQFIVAVLLCWTTSLAPRNTSALQWQDGGFNGQVKWAFNCEFDTTADDDDRNEVDGDVMPTVGRYQSSRDDCAWLCWADSQCQFFTHSQDTCRTLSFRDGNVASKRNHQRRVRVPFLADGDTSCGYIPSRTTTSSNMSSTEEIDQD